MREAKEDDVRQGWVLGTAFLAAAVATAPAIAGGYHHGGRNVTVSMSDEGPIYDCGQIRVRFGETDAARAEEQLAAPAASRPLVMRMPANSGLYISGTDRRDVSIRACKAARAVEDLSRISVAVGADGRVSLHGPDNDDWLVYLLVEAPRSIGVDVEASNGPIGLRDLSGTVRARTINGPLSLGNLSGRVEARAKNGPISVNLSGTYWDGEGLDAHAINGPLTVRIPENYRSGTRIQSAGHSPFNCRASACSQARRSWEDESKAIEFGDSRLVVQLSTVNGPVSISESDE